MSGADFFLDLLQFETHLDGCDLVITGEGRIDDQTLHGKLPAIVARRAGTGPGHRRRRPQRPQRRPPGTPWASRAVHAIADHTDGNPATTPACPRGCSKTSAGPCPSLAT